MGLEAHLGLTDEVEAAGDADQVLPPDGAAGQLQGLPQAVGGLAHLTTKFRVYIRQLLRRDGLVRIAAREDDLVGPVLKLRQHPRDVLVAVTAENHDHGVVGDVLADGMDQCPDARGVMRAVDHDPRIVADHLHAPGQGDSVEPLGRLLDVDLVTCRPEFVQQRQGQSAVDGLVPAVQRHAQVLEFAGRRRQANPRVRAMFARGLEPEREVDIDTGHAQRRFDGEGLGFQDVHRQRLLLHADYRDTPLEDARFLHRDAVERVAELPLMVDAQAGNAYYFGQNDVSAVEPAAQAGLDDTDIDLAVGKIPKRQRRHNLKERGRIGLGQLLDGGVQPIQQRQHLRFADHPRVDGNALMQVHQVR